MEEAPNDTVRHFSYHSNPELSRTQQCPTVKHQLPAKRTTTQREGEQTVNVGLPLNL